MWVKKKELAEIVHGLRENLKEAERRGGQVVKRLDDRLEHLTKELHKRDIQMGGVAKGCMFRGVFYPFKPETCRDCTKWQTLRCPELACRGEQTELVLPPGDTPTCAQGVV